MRNKLRNRINKWRCNMSMLITSSIWVKQWCKMNVIWIGGVEYLFIYFFKSYHHCVFFFRFLILNASCPLEFWSYKPAHIRASAKMAASMWKRFLQFLDVHLFKIRDKTWRYYTNYYPGTLYTKLLLKWYIMYEDSIGIEAARPRLFTHPSDKWSRRQYL